MRSKLRFGEQPASHLRVTLDRLSISNDNSFVSLFFPMTLTEARPCLGSANLEIFDVQHFACPEAPLFKRIVYIE